MANSQLTDIGLQKFNTADPLNPVKITHIAVGDGNGSTPTVDPSRTSLVNEVYRGTASLPIVVSTDPKILRWELEIPANEGGFTVREACLIDEDGDMLSFALTDPILKPDPATSIGNIYIVELNHTLINEDDDLVIDFNAGRGVPSQNVEMSQGGSLQKYADENDLVLKAYLVAQGLSGNFGYFVDGFNYNLVGDVGIDIDGKIYTYSGTNPLPVSVDAGTDPVGDSDYLKINFSKLKHFDSVENVLQETEDLNIDDTVFVNGYLWKVESSEGINISGGKFLSPINSIDPANFLDLEDTATLEKFRPALRGRLMNLTDAFRDIMNRSNSGAVPIITCYGDSNTRYYEGDNNSNGPLSKSYGAYIDLFSSEYPCLYGSTVSIQGNPGKTSDFAVSNFSTQVPSNSNFVVLGWGTNNVKLPNADMNSYINDIIALFENCLSIGAMPIMLGIPWYSNTYGSDGQLSQDRLKTWNATLYALCSECNVPFIDTYNLTRIFTATYFNEATIKRHYSPQATKQIAQKIIDVLNTVMTSSGDFLGHTQKTWGDYSKFKNSEGAISRANYNNGGMSFEVLKIAEGASIVLSGKGRGCIAFYPRADATVNIETGFQSITENIVSVIDNGEYYNVKRIPLNFTHFGKDYDLTITATTGDLYVRVISFEDSATTLNVYSSTYEEINASDLPVIGVVGRQYFVIELLRPVWYKRVSNKYFGAEGLIAVGTTATRNAVASVCPNGYKYFNTDSGQGERYDINSGTWSAI